MNSRILLASAFTALSFSAFAADLPRRSVAPVAPAPVFSWTGFYVGANGGYGFGKSSASDIALNGVAYPARNGSFDTHGGLVGGQIGYNHQFGNYVVGVEADFDFANVKGSYVIDPQTDLASQSHVNGKIENFGTVRARAGYAFDNVLIFATGGFAYGSTKTSITNFTNSNSPLVTSTATPTGYVLGAGAEYALTNNWIVKAEYLYVNFGKKSASFSELDLTATTNVRTTLNVVRLGVNYKF